MPTRTREVCLSRDGVEYGGVFFIDGDEIVVTFHNQMRREKLLANIQSPIALAKFILGEMIDKERRLERV